MTEQRKEALNYIIDNKQIKPVFQPIISLWDGSVLGHEALSRTKALEAAYKFMIPPYSKKLFLNVNPNIMHDDSFKKGFTRDFLKQYDITPNNVIFEITEKNVVLDMAGFRATIDHYKSQDYRIAIDDAGAGYSGLNLISDVNPNYIKLDMKLIRGVNTDYLKYALVKGMVEFSKGANISLIAEGIETCEELDTLINLGVQYGQGYLIQKPEAEVIEIEQEVLDMLKMINLKKNHTSQSIISNI